MKNDTLARSDTSPPVPDVLLFDLDGVLADVRDSYRMCILETARYFNARVDLDSVSEAKNRPDANNDWLVTQRIIQDQTTRDIPLDDIIDVFQGLYMGTNGREGFRERERLLLPVDLLERMNDRYVLGIVTGRPREECQWFLDRFGLTPFFRTAICMEDAPAKPSPDGILLAMERLKGTTGWMFGDTVDDMAAARQADAVSDFNIIAVGVPAPDSMVNTPDLLRAAGATAIVGQTKNLTDLLP